MSDLDLSWDAFDQQRGTKPRQPAQQQPAANSGTMAGYDGPPLPAAVVAKIRDFQKKEGLPVTGNLDGATVKAANNYSDKTAKKTKKGTSSKSAAKKTKLSVAKALAAQEKKHKKEIAKLNKQHAAALKAAAGAQSNADVARSNAVHASGVNEGGASAGTTQAQLDAENAAAPTGVINPNSAAQAAKAKAAMAAAASANKNSAAKSQAAAANFQKLTTARAKTQGVTNKDNDTAKKRAAALATLDKNMKAAAKKAAAASVAAAKKSTAKKKAGKK